MTTPTIDPVATQPRIVDFPAGRPARIAGVPVPLNVPSYMLKIFKDDTWGSTQLFESVESEPGLPVFYLTAAQTSSIGTLLVAASPCGFDNTSATAATGWYTITGSGTDPDTLTPVDMTSAYGPLVVRLDPGLTRRPAPSYYPPANGCGCGGDVLNALPCGCGGCSGGTPCDHAPVPAPGDCAVLTQRARFKGTYKGEFDPLATYMQWDVVEATDGRYYVKVCPDGWGPVTP